MGQYAFYDGAMADDSYSLLWALFAYFGNRVHATFLHLEKRFCAFHCKEVWLFPKMAIGIWLFLFYVVVEFAFPWPKKDFPERIEVGDCLVEMREGMFCCLFSAQTAAAEDSVEFEIPNFFANLPGLLNA